MVFQASDYVIWMVFILLETLAFRFASKPEHKPFRALMGMCLMRDFILLTWSCHQKYYWDIFWAGNECEWIFMAWTAGILIGKGKSWRFPAFTIAALSVHYALQNKWPILSRPEEMFHFERNCCLIILGMLLIGSLFIYQKSQLRLAGSLAVLAGADMFAAQSYLIGNYSPMMASVVWVVGLGILVAALRANPEQQHKILCAAQAASVSTTGNSSGQGQESPSESKPTSEFSPLQELIAWPCHTRVQ